MKNVREKKNELTLLNDENDGNLMQANSSAPKKNVYNVTFYRSVHFISKCMSVFIHC